MRRLLRRGCAAALCAAALCAACSGGPGGVHPECDEDNGGITLPPGFCAAVFADAIGIARHVVVAANGTVYVAMEDRLRTSAATSKRREPGGVMILRDTTGDGRADLQRLIPTGGGTGIALRDGWLYYTTMTTVERVRLTADGLGTTGGRDTLVTGLPPEGHISRSLALDESGGLFVHVGSDSNVCTARRDSQGLDPCPELPSRAGIWRYAADRLHQRHPREGERWATGLRNAVALAWDTVSHALFAASHGRDGLATLWPTLYTAEQSAEQPSEEFVRVERGDDFGWPYCFHDNSLGRKVLAPEYGGDGKSEGRCTVAKEPVIGFPGHWGPNGLVFLTGRGLPAGYRGAALIAFHGSWNRAPRPQAGYKVVLVPRGSAGFGPQYQTFADGFAGGHFDPGRATHRPVGLAEGPDGTLYITDDQRGRVWAVHYGER